MKPTEYTYKGRIVKARNKEDAARKFVGTRKNHLGNEAIPNLNEMMKLITRVKKGFTRIELMIMVAICGILLAVLIQHIPGMEKFTSYDKYKLSDGTIVECAFRVTNARGGTSDLTRCKDGHDYLDQANFSRIP